MSLLRSACAICESDKNIPLYRGLIKCQNCGFVWADLDISTDELRTLYSENYFFGAEYINYLLEEKALKVSFRQILDEILHKLPVSSTWNKPNLLEIGSAYGFFLDVAKDSFVVTGVELNESGAAYATRKGHRIFSGDFLSVDLQDQTFDVIISLATLEHLQNPDQHIQKVSKHLKPGGIFYCTTINIDSWLARWSGSRWRMIYPPSHVSYFSSQTLQKLAMRYHLQPISCRPIWQVRMLDVILAPLLTKQKSFQRLYQLVDHVGITRIPIPFNFGDVIALTARKQSV